MLKVSDRAQGDRSKHGNQAKAWWFVLWWSRGGTQSGAEAVWCCRSAVSMAPVQGLVLQITQEMVTNKCGHKEGKV